MGLLALSYIAVTCGLFSLFGSCHKKIQKKACTLWNVFSSLSLRS